MVATARVSSGSPTGYMAAGWAEEYRSRRARLLEKIGSGVAIFRSAPHAVMHNDVEYNYRQDSDFYYVTGFDEPAAVAVLAPNHEEHQFILFLRPKDRLAETWSGRRLGVEAAKEAIGADVVYPIEELTAKLPQYLQTGDRIFYSLGHDPHFDAQILDLWKQQRRGYFRKGRGPVALEDPIARLHQLRNIKSPLELAAMRQAADIAAEAHQRAMEMARPGCWEYEVQAELDRLCRSRGGWGPAYPAIVATGENACILHYVENNCQLQAGDLLLIDAGCAYGYYNSDITRTFPVNGRFSPEQQALYELVLAAQMAAIAAVKPGDPYSNVHDVALKVLVEGLLDLGLMVGSVEQIIEKELYRPFYPHRTSHWLGLDVHDVGVYTYGDDPCYLQPGQVLTVEPGLYIAPDIEPKQPGEEDDWPAQPEVPEQWRGIGIRIEDDVLVTEGGHDVLTAAVPKQVADLTWGKD